MLSAFKEERAILDYNLIMLKWLKRNSTVIMRVWAVILLINAAACLPLGPPSPVRVVIELPAIDLASRKVAIPDFQVPQEALGMGAMFADVLQRIVLERKLFLEVSRQLPVVWTHPGETMDAQLARIRVQSASLGYDLVLVGGVNSIFYGGIEDSRLAITLRVVEVKSGKTVFMATNQATSTPKDPSYPLDTQLTKSAQGPEQLAEKVLQQIVARWK